MATATATKTAPPRRKDRATEYARAVVEGREFVVGRLVRLACERHLRDLEEGPERGLRWDVREADKVIRFFSLLEHTKGEWAGRELELEPWQAFIVGSAFGWQRWDEERERWVRRFRVVYVEIARKNGKTTLVAGVGDYLAFFDGEAGAEVYAAATKLDQAKVLWGESKRQMQRLRRKSPAAAARIRVLTNVLFDESSDSKFEPLGADASTLDGLNCHANLVDELHAHPDRGLWDVLEEAQAARLQPMHFAITTAGHDRHGICWEIREYSISVLERVFEDDSHFAYIATLDEGDDWRDPAVWPKANPNLGVSVNRKYLAEKVRRAQRTPGLVNSTLQKHFNVWTTAEHRWFDVERWRELQRWRWMVGRRAVGGLDLAGTKDLNAYVLVFPDGIGGYDVIPTFWMPRENLARRVREDRVPYDVWAREGWIELTDGVARNDQAILDGIRERNALFDVPQLGVDPWQMNYIATSLVSDGVDVVKVPQTFGSLAEASRELEKVIETGQLRHDGNPVMTWMCSNVVADEDAAGNRKPSKKHSRERIDGFSGLVTALSLAIVLQAEKRPSLQIFL
ncbi:MAG: terminase large subunit [Dehalococcoidia bacterium]